MNLSDIFGMTVAQGVAWLLSTGIVGIVAYGLSFVQWDDAAKKKIAYVLTAVLVALVTALSSFIPDSWQALKLIDAAFALIATIAGAFGGWHFGEFKAEQHSLSLESERMFIAETKMKINS